jgi:hypothetical protein
MMTMLIVRMMIDVGAGVSHTEQAVDGAGAEGVVPLCQV